jgi:hypothetical protein
MKAYSKEQNASFQRQWQWRQKALAKDSTLVGEALALAAAVLELEQNAQRLKRALDKDRARRRAVGLVRARKITGARNRSFVSSLVLEASCMDCNTDDFRVLEFDHRPDENKKGEISQMIHNTTLSRLRNEIAKCDIVCANCHRIRTMRRANTMKHQLYNLICEGM